MALETEMRGSDAVPLRLIDGALGRYGLTRLSAPALVPESVLSENYRVETNEGPRFLRIHKKTRTLERIEAEYAMLRWAGDRGIPVVAPLEDLEGRALHRVEGRFVSLFPWIEGRSIDPARATAEDASRLGEVHGRVTSVLARYDGEWLRGERRYPRWDTEKSIAELSRVDDVIRYYPAPPPEQIEVQRMIRFQLQRLESGEARPVSDFDGLTRQACHGDFHERQVLFGAGDEVLAVVDWEGLAWAPPMLELLRAITLSGMLRAGLAEAYLAGYARNATIRRDEAEPAVECWWQTQLHGTWSLTTRFIEGDRRPERFFASEWANLKQFADPEYRRRLAGLVGSYQ